MLVMEKTERYFSACLLASADSSSPLSFLVMSSDTRRQRGKDTNTDTILFLCFGTVMENISLNLDGKTGLKQESKSSLNTKRALLPMTITMKNRIQYAWRKDWMRMRMRVRARKLGRTKARLSRKLSKRRESMASKTTEKMDQVKEINGITVPNSLGRQLPTWSQTDDSASTTLENIASKAPYSLH